MEIIIFLIGGIIVVFILYFLLSTLGTFIGVSIVGIQWFRQKKKAKVFEETRVFGNCPYCGMNIGVLPPGQVCPRCSKHVAVSDDKKLLTVEQITQISNTK